MANTKQNKVAYIVKMYPRFSETFIVNEILAHEEAGLELEIYSLRPPDDGRFHESLARVRAPVTYLPRGGTKLQLFWDEVRVAAACFPDLWSLLKNNANEAPGDIYQAMVLARHLRETGVTHLHAHFGTVATSVTRLAAQLLRLPYTFTAHAKDIFHVSVESDDLQRKLRDAAATITVSDFNLRYLRRNYGADAGKVERIYNGLDLDRFVYSSPAGRPLEIISVGRLVEKKGFPDLIAACDQLARRVRSFRCTIVGKGPLEAQLAEQIRTLGLNNHVRLVGPRPQGEVMKLVQGASVFAAPCIVGEDGNRDGLPTVLLEAMALGTPCVSTDVTGIPEILRHGETGLMVPQQDPAALAQALHQLLESEGLRVKLAANARRLIESEFDIHQNSAVMRRLFSAQPCNIKRLSR